MADCPNCAYMAERLNRAYWQQTGECHQCEHMLLLIGQSPTLRNVANDFGLSCNVCGKPVVEKGAFDAMLVNG